MITAIVNQKGGVGKTCAAINLGYQVASCGHRVLIIDCDSQGNTSGTFLDKTVGPNIVDVMKDRKFNPAKAVYKVDCPFELYCLPSNIKLSKELWSLYGVNYRETILKSQLKKIEGQFDYIFIDCPPSFDVMTTNAIVAASLILIPLDSSNHAVDGLSDLLDIVNYLREPGTFGLSIFKNIFQKNTSIANKKIDLELDPLKSNLCRTVIRRKEDFNKATHHSRTIFEFDEKSTGCVDYRNLADELFLGIKNEQRKEKETVIPYSVKS